jgi:hypothetical protein
VREYRTRFTNNRDTYNYDAEQRRLAFVAAETEAKRADEAAARKQRNERAAGATTTGPAIDDGDTIITTGAAVKAEPLNEDTLQAWAAPRGDDFQGWGREALADPPPVDEDQRQRIDTMMAGGWETPAERVFRDYNARMEWAHTTHEDDYTGGPVEWGTER